MMAAKNEETSDGFNGIIICQLCSKSFTNSRMLPCTHTFCLLCLEELMNSKQNPEDGTKCPICQQAFEIPDGGCSNLKRNYFVDRLLETKKISSMSESHCDVCNEEEDFSKADKTVNPAKLYCIECEQKLCEMCSNEHRRQKFLKLHNLVAIGESASGKQLVAENAVPSFCHLHGHEVVKMYCTSCVQVICMMCFAESHQSHSCISVNKVVDEFRQSLVEVDDSLKTVKERAELRKERLKTEKINNSGNIEASRSAVIKRTEQLKELVENHKMLLLRALDSAECKYKQEVETIEKEINKAMKVMDTFRNYSEALRVNGSPSDICQSTKELKSATRNYLKRSQKSLEPQLNPFTDTFIATDISEFEQNIGNIVGRMVPSPDAIGIAEHDDDAGGSVQTVIEKLGADVEKVPTEVKQDVQKVISVVEEIAEQPEQEKRTVISLPSLKLVKRFETICSVCGVAYLKGFIHVLTPTSVLVHTSQKDFDLVKTIMLPPETEIKDGTTSGLAASEGINCLYLRCGSAIWKLTADGSRAELWMTSEGQITSMSAAIDGTVLLGTVEKEEIQRNEGPVVTRGKRFRTMVAQTDVMHVYLCIYASNRKLTHKFLMPNHRRSLHQAIFASNGNIIICFADNSEVVEMNLQGVVCRRYQHPCICGFHGRKVDCMATKGTRLFIGYVSSHCQCCNKLIAINSNFQLEYIILPSTNYKITNFNYILFSDNYSQLFTVTGGSPEGSYNPFAINVFSLLNA